MRLFKKDFDHNELKKQLLIVIDLLDKHNIPYHLEGGTLLGIVRDNKIIPWDHDTDISIMSCDFERTALIFNKIKQNNLRLKVKNFEEENVFSQNKSPYLIKVKDKKFHFFSGDNTLDVFIKYLHNENVYWAAQNNIMSVPKKFYTGFDEIKWENRMIKVPLHYKEYLTLKYGDWQKINKDWNCDMELTIVKKRSE